MNYFQTGVYKDAPRALLLKWTGKAEADEVYKFIVKKLVSPDVMV